ncbi:hypothetical protein KFE96_04590 [Kordiimonas sp. SCSIO 12603]|uniref:hypothetical protein n=1 Tax=Kordiimonas sp. SCSIO 12603 TaxID=2829596 RepID=UPI002103A503|nr:hypothetical protein [Kordiimonas sp. SCSIO 12603]UTW59591.1 hypothetical protein KFE96_04590 [Kordiimonas sp. SCSIO 12603]
MRLFFVLLLVIISNHVLADEKKISSVINLYGVTFQHGTPPWITDVENPFLEVRPFRNQKGRNFVFELIPRDESFKNWKSIFAVSALKNNRPIAAKIWSDYSLQALRDACQSYSEEVLLMEKNIALIKVYCPKVVGVPMPGYEGDVGEIGVFAFLVMDNVLINHHIEWRGSAFDTSNPETWPISVEGIEKGLTELKKAKAISSAGMLGFDSE